MIYEKGGESGAGFRAVRTPGNDGEAVLGAGAALTAVLDVDARHLRVVLEIVTRAVTLRFDIEEALHLVREVAEGLNLLLGMEIKQHQTEDYVRQ